MLYFERAGGKGFYPPKPIKTDAKGNFSLTYVVNKPAGNYRWYAVEPKTGRKSKRMTYTVFEPKDASVYAALRAKNSASNSSSSRSTHAS